jgi:hypothetical protein
MKYFYNPEYENNNDVLEAWYMYVMKFLPLVSKKWRDCTSSEKLRNHQSMFLSVTISDEAVVRWFILLWVPIHKAKYQICQKDLHHAKDSQEKGGIEDDAVTIISEQDSSKVRLIRKPHDTKKNIKMYSLLHQEITNARQDYNAAVRWNKLFWKKVLEKNENLVQKKKTFKSKYELDNAEIPLPGMNEKQEFLASYSSIAYDTAQALVSLSPGRKSKDNNGNNNSC